jgi:ribose transport system substrate-binding protein
MKARYTAITKTVKSRMRRRSGFVTVTIVLLGTLMVIAAGCGGGDDGGEEAAPAATTAAAEEPGATEEAAATEESTEEPAEGEGAHLPIQAPTECGGPVVFEKTDPDGVLADLVASAPDTEAWYQPHFAEVRATPWADFPKKEGPWKIGFVNFPVDNPWQVGLLEQLQAEFAAAKEQGLVEGELQVYIQPDWATATPEQQTAAIQQMIRDGVDGLLVHPLNSRAETPSFDEAGTAGVPVVLTGDIAPDSEYAVNVNTFNQSPGFSDFLKLQVDKGWFQGEPRKALEIRGIEGNTFEQTAHDAAMAALAPCEGVEIVGTVWGGWNPATTKAEVLKFLASYPGEIDFVMHEGAMAAGVIQAFEEAGREVPPMPISGTSGGDLSWWDANKDTYETVGYHFSGAQMGHATFGILMRILNGQGLKLRDIAPPAVKATNENISEIATPGQPVTWIGDIRGDVEDYLNDEEFDYFFTTPGDPVTGS